MSQKFTTADGKNVVLIPAMNISYKNQVLERLIIVLNYIVSAAVAASFVIMLGFEKPIFDRSILYTVQIATFFCFLIEKIFRFFNARKKSHYLRAIWFEFPLLTVLLVVIITTPGHSEAISANSIRITAIWIYLIVQVIDKVCRSVVNLAASGRNPTQVLILSFVVLIFVGAGLLMLPKTHNCDEISFIDSLFTATSATCVTGLIVKDTGRDFSLAGQFVILTLIQLGGLGLMVFGAVFALLLRQAISVRESVAMQDVLSSETLGKISTIIAFIFTATVIIEALGAVAMHGMWAGQAYAFENIENHQIFASIFHSISAFCNAGFGLCSDSLISYRDSWQVYGVFCPLIILGGLGFGVLFDISTLIFDKIKLVYAKIVHPKKLMHDIPKKMSLQSKIVLSFSAFLIIAAMLLMMIFEWANNNSDFTLKQAFFQSVTTRTAGFNTVDISQLSPASKLIMIVWMFIGGSPGSTAGGIKTVTLFVIIMAVWATIRKRSEVEIFKRSVRLAIIGRAITVVTVFMAVLFTVTLILVITERGNNFAMSNIMFEAASALGTVGLTTGITSSLTGAGKLVIILTMLIGRLGPLTLLASLTFNLKPARYNYPNEALMVG